jgi:hypothetical protein
MGFQMTSWQGGMEYDESSPLVCRAYFDIVCIMRSVLCFFAFVLWFLETDCPSYCSLNALLSQLQFIHAHALFEPLQNSRQWELTVSYAPSSRV